MLTFVAPQGKDTGGRIVWELLCDCGKTTYAIPHNVTSDSIKSCGCYSKSIRKSNGENRRQYDPVISSARTVWRTVYKDIDFDTFYKVSQQNCHYCGRPPHKTFNQAQYPRAKGGISSDNQKVNGNFIYNGLDRIDSSIGHTPENVVACCWTCNRMKGSHNAEDFLSHIKLICEYRVDAKVKENYLEIIHPSPNAEYWLSH